MTQEMYSQSALPRFLILGLTFCTALFGYIDAASAQQRPRTMLILDASRSMWGQINNVNKIVIAHQVLEQTFKRYDGRFDLGLVAYGHRKSASCQDVQTVIPLGTLKAQAYTQKVKQIKPKGSTPISVSLNHAAKAAQYHKHPTNIVLISDGLDNCKGNPCATAIKLKSKAPNLKIHVIAFNNTEQEKLRTLACVSQKTGGKFASAKNQSELKLALTNTLDSFLVPTAAVSQSSGPAQNTGQISKKTPVKTENDKTQTTVKTSIEAPNTSVAVKPTRPKIHVTPDTSSKDSKGLVPATFKALLTENGKVVNSGLIWRVFDARPGKDGKYRLISTHRDSNPTAALKPGEYLVNAAYGRAHLTKKIKIKAGETLNETFVLNSGGLRLSSVLANGELVPNNSVSYTLYSDERDQFGNRQKVMTNAKPGLIIRLNAGIYRIVSRYGDANAIVEADVTVEPGKLTEATINHSAAKVTFKLVFQPGGEALPDTQWSVLTSQGDVIKESAGALPTHILAAGNYTVLARHKDKNYKKTFAITSGETKQIEVVIQ